MDETLFPTPTVVASNRGSKYKPPSGMPLEAWIRDIKAKQMDIIERKSNRNKRRQEMAKRHTVASQERMRIISLLASNEKGSDEFGKDDTDWDVYKKISNENESDSEAENEKLFEYDNIMKYHHAVIDRDKETVENTAELYQVSYFFFICISTYICMVSFEILCYKQILFIANELIKNYLLIFAYLSLQYRFHYKKYEVGVLKPWQPFGSQHLRN